MWFSIWLSPFSIEYSFTLKTANTHRNRHPIIDTKIKTIISCLVKRQVQKPPISAARLSAALQGWPRVIHTGKLILPDLWHHPRMAHREKRHLVLLSFISEPALRLPSWCLQQTYFSHRRRDPGTLRTHPWTAVPTVGSCRKCRTSTCPGLTEVY